MKVIKNSPGSSDMLIAGEGYSQITSGANSVTVTRDSGVYINGPVSLSSPIDNVKISGIFKLNTILASCLPSTMITPMPTFVMDMPIKNLSSMAGIAAILKGIM